MVRCLERLSDRIKNISLGVREFYLICVIVFSALTLSFRYYALRFGGGVVSDLDPLRFSVSFITIFEYNQYWRLLTSLFVFGSLDEFLLGIILIYRVCGLQCVYSQKSLLLCIISCMVSSILIQTILLLLLPTATSISPGFSIPYGVLLTYMRDMPYSWRCRLRCGRYLCPIFITDKWITYILALQLVFADFPISCYTGLTIFISGIIYRSFILCRRCKKPPPASNDYNTVPEEEFSAVQLADLPIELSSSSSSSSGSSDMSDILLHSDTNLDASSLTSNYKPPDLNNEKKIKAENKNNVKNKIID